MGRSSVPRVAGRNRRAGRPSERCLRSTDAIAASVSSPVGSSPPARGSSKLSSSRRFSRPMSRSRMRPASEPEGRLDRGAQPGDNCWRVADFDRRRFCAAAICIAEFGIDIGRGEIVASRTRCTRVPMSRPTGIPASKDGVAMAGSSRPPAVNGGGVVGSSSARMVSSGSLVTRAS